VNSKINNDIKVDIIVNFIRKKGGIEIKMKRKQREKEAGFGRSCSK
jgi:hypothetical protein